MADNWAYASLSVLKAQNSFRPSVAIDDTTLLGYLEDATRQVDFDTGRTFRTQQLTRYFTPRRTDHISIDDLLSITTLKTDLNADRSYAVAWVATDYDLQPFDAPNYQAPFERVDINVPQGTQQFVRGQALSVQIVGKWGYWERLQNAGTTLGAAIIDTTGTSVTLTDPTKVQMGQTLLIDSEQMYVSFIDSTSGANINPATVERGINGTVAATHLNSAAIQRYVYPQGVRDACLLEALRLWRREEAPFGLVTQPASTGAPAGLPATVARIPVKDPDYDRKLRPFSKRITGVW